MTKTISQKGKEMEEKNMARVELTPELAEQIVGGKFSFYQDYDGTYKCKVTGYGTFNTDKNGFFNYINMRNTNPGLTEAEYFEIAKNDLKFIW